MRSSVKFIVGEDGAVDMAPYELFRDSECDAVIIGAVRGPTEGAREELAEDMVATREGGCWRIRLRPEAPRPCSWSVIMEDLDLKPSITIIRKTLEPLCQ